MFLLPSFAPSLGGAPCFRLLWWIPLIAACGAEAIPQPRLTARTFQLQGVCRAVDTANPTAPTAIDCGCERNLSQKPGWGVPLDVDPAFDDRTNAVIAAACEREVHIIEDDGAFALVLYNHILPCFPDDISAKLLYERNVALQRSGLNAPPDPPPDPQGGYNGAAGRAGRSVTEAATFDVRLEAGQNSSVLNVRDRIHLRVGLTPAWGLGERLCAYRVQATVTDMERGEWTLKLWNHDGRPLRFLKKRKDGTSEAFDTLSIDL